MDSYRVPGPQTLRTWHFSASAERSSHRDSPPSAASSSPTCHGGHLRRTHPETAGLNTGREVVRRKNGRKGSRREERPSPPGCLQLLREGACRLRAGAWGLSVLQESPGTFKGFFMGLSLQMNCNFTFAHCTLGMFSRALLGVFCLPAQPRALITPFSPLSHYYPRSQMGRLRPG